MYSKESDEFLIKEFRSGNNKAFDALLISTNKECFLYPSNG